MKKIWLKMATVTLFITIVGGSFVGCGNKTSNNNESKEGEKVSGSITAAGSSALQPLAKVVADMFMKENTKAQINIQGGGSGTGLSQVASGAVQIGNSDLFAEDKIKDSSIVKNLVDHKVAVIGFAMVVNKDVKVDSLTKTEIQSIFTGKITNWKEVGGQDLKIQVINRGKSSGTRSTFIKNIMDEKSEAEGLGTTQDSSGAVQKAVETTEGAISYLALSYFVNEEAQQGMNLLKINEIEANTESITKGKYPFWSYEHMYTKEKTNGLTKAFLEYIVSDEVKPVIKNKGYIPVSDMEI